MSVQINKYNIRIPQDVSVIYSKKKRALTIVGPLKKKSMKLKLKVTIDGLKKIISVSPLPFSKISNAERKKIKALRNTTVAEIKHLIIESSITIFQKLQIVGVGYRVDFTDVSEKELLTLKLGYSHVIYVRIPKDFSLNCFTKTNFCIFGSSYHGISKLSAKIRSKKIPEPYKGKGILYENETILLKEGKKI